MAAALHLQFDAKRIAVARAGTAMVRLYILRFQRDAGYQIVGSEDTQWWGDAEITKCRLI